MGLVLFILISVNVLVFAGIGAWAWRYRRREQSPRIRFLAGALGVVALAFVLGALTRLIGVAVRLEWLDGRVGDFIVSEWHLLQSVAATSLGVVGASILRQHALSWKSADRIASAVSDRLLNGSSLTDFGFTNREVEVLRAIAAGHLSDAQIAEILFIAPATAGTHVKNILKKTGVRSRRELALLVASSNL